MSIRNPPASVEAGMPVIHRKTARESRPERGWIFEQKDRPRAVSDLTAMESIGYAISRVPDES